MLINLRNALMTGSGGSMPATEVDYIDGNLSRNSYIELGIHPNTNSEYELETIVYDTSYNNKTICAALDTSPSLFWFFLAQTFNRKLDLNYGSNGADDAGIVCFVNSHRMKIRSFLANGVQKGWVTDISAGGNEALVTNTTFTAPANHTMSSTLRLFNRTNILADCVKRLGRTKLSVDGVLAFDLIPCLTDDGVYTMWNAVTGSFANKVGTFTGGMW